MSFPQKRAHAQATMRFYKRLRAFYLILLVVIVGGPLLYVFGSQLAASLLMLGAVIGAFFFGVSFGRMIETVGRRAYLDDEERRRQEVELNASERLYDPDRDL
jgi:hypothetical protein